MCDLQVGRGTHVNRVAVACLGEAVEIVVSMVRDPASIIDALLAIANIVIFEAHSAARAGLAEQPSEGIVAEGVNLIDRVLHLEGLEPCSISLCEM